MGHACFHYMKMIIQRDLNRSFTKEQIKRERENEKTVINNNHKELVWVGFFWFCCLHMVEGYN